MTTKISTSNSSIAPKAINNASKNKNSFFRQQVKNKMEQSEKFHKLNQSKIANGTDIAYKNIAAEFEIAFESFMYNLQFSTVEVDPLMGGGIGEEVFRSQLVDSMIQKMREDNPGNIAKAIYNKIKKDDSSNNNKGRISESNDK